MFNKKTFKCQPDRSLLLDTTYTAQFMLQKIFNTNYSLTAIMECSYCQKYFVRDQLFITVNLPTADLLFFKDVMENYNLS